MDGTSRSNEWQCPGECYLSSRRSHPARLVKRMYLIIVWHERSWPGRFLSSSADKRVRVLGHSADCTLKIAECVKLVLIVAVEDDTELQKVVDGVSGFKSKPTAGGRVFRTIRPTTPHINSHVFMVPPQLRTLPPLAIYSARSVTLATSIKRKQTQSRSPAVPASRKF